MAFVASAAYAFVDLLIMTVYHEQFKKIWKIYVFHHGIMILSPLYSYYAPSSKALVVAKTMSQLYLSEIPIITLNLNWFLIKFEMNRNYLFKISDSITLSNYFVFRIVNFSYVIPTVLKTIPIAIVLNVLLILLNLYWFTGLCYNHFFGRNNKRDEIHSN
jgi:hypothetical protein